MPRATFEVDGMDEFINLVDRFVSKEFMSAAETAMRRALLVLHGSLPEYPPPPQPGEASKHWTDKQRRWFFAALAEGEIQVPYRRTETLGRRFTTRVEKLPGATIGGVIGIDVPYAPWVVGPPESEPITLGGVTMFQAPIHRGRWWQFYVEVEKNLPDAYDEFLRVFYSQLELEWRG